MSIAKTIEIVAESTVNWEDAAKLALKEASKTVKNISGIWIKDMKAIVENNQITRYRVNCKITFIIK